ncbi:MAG: capsule assembly Wzi family protein [Chlorobium sp.]|nr:MAG: capsule assembly Wzi family protein [Chlorobium sp.]
MKNLPTMYIRIVLLLAVAMSAFTAQHTARAADKKHSEWLDSLVVSTGAIWSTQDKQTFWLQSNQHGRFGREGNLFFNRLRLGKQDNDEKKFDWSYGLDLTGRSGNDSDIAWTDAYAGLRYKDLKLTVGRKSEFFGLADSLLTAGPELYSSRAPNIPKIALSTNGFVNISEDFAINAYLAHGWLGEEQYVKNAYLHQKFFYMRYGTENTYDGINIYAGLHHVVVWGGTDRVTGFRYPSGINDFAKIFFGKAGGSDASSNDQAYALGNHLGSIEYAIQFKGYERDWFLYAQTLFEDSSGLVGGGLIKPGDYLLGLSLINKEPDATIKRINLEYLDTTGESMNSDGSGSYFNHGEYFSGWTYEGYGIGHPFITSIPGQDYRWFAQNWLKGANVGMALEFSDLVNPTIRFAWIRQKGVMYAPRPAEDTFAFAINNSSRIARNWTFEQAFFFDAGKAIEPNAAMLLSISRSFF